MIVASVLWVTVFFWDVLRKSPLQRLQIASFRVSCTRSNGMLVHFRLSWPGFLASCWGPWS